jgi:thiol-disulfide isomerase/thioredoxin
MRDVVEDLEDADEAADPQDRERFALLLLKRVEQSPTHVDAAWLLTYLCSWSHREQAKAPASFAEAAELLRKHHLRSPELANFCEHLGGGESGSAPAWAGDYEGLLRAIAKENRSRYVRGQALYALANVVRGAGEARQDEAIQLYRAYQKEFDGKDPPTASLEQGQRETADRHIRTIGILRIGKPAPEIDGVDTDGKPLKLSSFKGNVVMLSVWGTWCVPCMKFVPHERKLVERMKGKPFALIGINLDEYNEAFQTRAKKEGITWRSFQNQRKRKPDISDELSLVFPSVVLIDHTGVVRAWWKGAPALDVLDREIDKLVEAASKK